MGNIKPDFILQNAPSRCTVSISQSKKREGGTGDWDEDSPVETSSNQDTDEITVTDWDQ
jgi:hypothetical protein